MRFLKSLTLVSALSASFIIGCEGSDEEASVPPMPGTDAATGYESPQSTMDGVANSRNSTLGQAKGTAQDIINQAEQSSQDLANEFDKLNGGGGR